MGLFSSWGNMLSPAPQTDTPVQNPLLNYNDSVAQAKLDRSRAIASALQKQALEKQQQGQFFKSGDFTGYAGGATLGSALMQGLAGLASNEVSNRADQQQKQQGQDQIAAMALRQGIMNGQLDQDGLKPGAQQLPTDLQSPSDVNLPDVSNIPARPEPAPTATAGTPPPPPTLSPQAVKAAKLLSAGSGRGGQGGPTAAELQTEDANGYLPNEGVLDRAGRRLKSAARLISGADNNGAGPGNVLPQDPQAALASLLPNAGGMPMMRPNLQGAQPAPVQQPAPAPMPQAVQQPAMPNINAAPQPAPAPQPQPAPVDPTMAHMQVPQQQLDERTQNLFRLAQTGPQGQQLATAELNQLYGNKNGRFSTTVHADPVNGGFIQVVTDTATGRTNSEPLATGKGTKGAFTETTAADGTRMKVYKNGSPSEPVLDANGAPVKDASVIKANDDQKLKTGAAVVANQSARSAIDSSLARLDRIEQLYKETETGPVAGSLPNWTAKRQELHALLAQDIFAETRDAVAGAADSGGAPRMAQSEFKYMANNGGLSQNTSQEAASNLIAQQRLRLNALRGTLAKHAETLGGIQGSQGVEEPQAPAGAMYKWQKKN